MKEMIKQSNKTKRKSNKPMEYFKEQCKFCRESHSTYSMGYPVCMGHYFTIRVLSKDPKLLKAIVKQLINEKKEALKRYG
jgi:hypothetical protein